jgi:hypothetical protein
MTTPRTVQGTAARTRPEREPGYSVAQMVSRSAAPALVLMVGIFCMVGARVTVRVNAWVAVQYLFLASRSSGTPRPQPS